MSERPYTVLVAVGDEEAPDAALLYAARIAEREGGVLRLVHVIPDKAGTTAQVHPLIDFGAVQVVGEELVAAAAERVRLLGMTDVRVETATLSGATVEELVREAGRADLVVVQHRLLPRLRRLFTGSVALGLAARCPVPVVSVPELWAPWPGHGERVVVGVDEEPSRRPLLDRAFTRAADEGLPLHVVHAWHFPQVYDAGWADPGLRTRWEHEVHEQLEHDVAEVAVSHPDVAVTTEMVRGRAADVLVEASRTSALVIVERDSSSHHIGGVTRTLLRESTCPVEVAPLSHAGAGSPQ